MLQTSFKPVRELALDYSKQAIYLATKDAAPCSYEPATRSKHLWLTEWCYSLTLMGKMY